MVDDRLRLQSLQTMNNKFNFQNNRDVKHNNLKLTHEEINNVKKFADLSEQDTEALANFIYKISIILYKTHDNGKP